MREVGEVEEVREIGEGEVEEVREIGEGEGGEGDMGKFG